MEGNLGKEGRVEGGRSGGSEERTEVGPSGFGAVVG